MYSACIHKLLVLICDVQLRCIINCELVCENLESFFPFKNMQIEDVHTEQLSEIIIGSHEENPRWPLVTQVSVGGTTAVHLCSCLSNLHSYKIPLHFKFILVCIHNTSTIDPNIQECIRYGSETQMGNVSL